MKLLTAISLGVTLLTAAGCYSTQEGRSKFGVPLSKDTIESRYERSVDQVFAAAKDTLAFNGTLTGENTIAKTLAASIDNRTVWVKVDEVEPRVSRIFVQARKSGGAADIYLASEIDKQIALRLK
ncbi:MAG TPA: hypothetical protein VMB21_18260 [Candidatus Limnocylindria bacterium]|jgi:hypothetical protein|nr:hypothetical protein [Candidatus Limnocylindria bacterium]